MSTVNSSPVDFQLSMESFLVGGEKVERTFPLLLELPQGAWLLQSLALVTAQLILQLRMQATKLALSNEPTPGPIPTSSQPLKRGMLLCPLYQSGPLGSQRPLRDTIGQGMGMGHPPSFTHRVGACQPTPVPHEP